jgi:hypothetical protein
MNTTERELVNSFRAARMRKPSLTAAEFLRQEP